MAEEQENKQEEVITEVEVETADEPATQESSDELAAVQEKLESMQEEFENKYKRLQADFDNFRRRTQSEKDMLRTFVKSEIFLSLLPVLDSFERALKTVESEDSQAFLEGFSMIQDNLKEILQKQGLEKIEALGAAFDPNYHNAVMRGESEEFDNDQVCEVFQEGYTVDGKTIRPAMVKVVNN